LFPTLADFKEFMLAVVRVARVEFAPATGIALAWHCS
jgi:hypothetical protein